MVIETEQKTDSRDDIPFIIDAHEDIAWNWFELERNPAVSALVSREEEKWTTIPATVGNRTTGLPEWLAGRVGIVFSTLFVPPASAPAKWDRHTYSTADQAHALAGRQLDLYRELFDREPRISLISTQQELDQVIASWTEPEAEPIVGFVVLMEGADPIREPDEVEEWYARGVRVVGLSWASTRYAGGTREPGPLTPAGRQLLEEMANLNMVLDLSHMAEEAYLQAIDSYPGPIIASHSNPRKFLPTDRGLSDEMIHQLAERDGVVGIVPFNSFLKPGWQRKSEVSIDLVAQAIDHVAQVTGSSAHVGLGTDLDGGLGLESIPAEMDSVADLHLIGDLLRGRGYAPSDVGRIMKDNWLRILRKSLL